MSSSLISCLAEFSRQIGDHWQSTSTGAGAATTIVDSALMAKANEIVNDDTWVMLEEEPASAAAIYDERKVSSLSNTDGTLTVLTFAAAPGTGIDYSMHRLGSPSDKRKAIVAACRRAYPAIYKKVWDESRVSSNWLKDGSFEAWVTSTNLTYWTETTLTATQTSTAGLVRHGAYSAKLDTLAGTLSQTISNHADLLALRGHTARFTIQGYSTAASDLRISITDGVNTTYSGYHSGNSGWTEDIPQNDRLYVEQAIDRNAAAVTFTIHKEVGAATAYVDDARVIGPYHPRIYIGDLGLAQNQPKEVYIEPYYYSTAKDWIQVRDWRVDSDGYLLLPTWYPADRRLRIIGRGYLDFLASGVSSTAWTATVDVDQPQLDILIAEAILYFYFMKSVPNDTEGDRRQYQEMVNFWKQEAAERKARFKMPAFKQFVNYGVP